MTTVSPLMNITRCPFSLGVFFNAKLFEIMPASCQKKADAPVAALTNAAAMKSVKNLVLKERRLTCGAHFQEAERVTGPKRGKEYISL